jgi:hypothetical protein
MILMGRLFMMAMSLYANLAARIGRKSMQRDNLNTGSWEYEEAVRRSEERVRLYPSEARNLPCEDFKKETKDDITRKQSKK